MIQHLCKQCGESFQKFNNLQTKCGKCSYNLNAKPRKPIKKVGKVAKEWIATRNTFIKENPPNHQGYWQCAIQLPGCLGAITADQLQVDHIISRTHAPGKRNEQTNLQASCAPCNTAKGSRELSEGGLTS